MAQFKFIRKMSYTEEITVEAESLDEAQVKAEEDDGVRNNDDTVISLQAVN